MIKELKRIEFQKKKYFIDFRLREFRNVKKYLERFFFKSDLGDRILCKGMRTGIITEDEYGFII
jgi:hypothetical protein